MGTTHWPSGTGYTVKAHNNNNNNTKREYYHAKKHELQEKTRTNEKPKVEKWAKEFLHEKLQAEYDLYALIKRVFYYKIGKLGFDDFY